LQSDADLIFGGITIVSGILGTLAGGFVLDFVNNTISNAFKVGSFDLRGKELGLLSLILLVDIHALFSSCWAVVHRRAR
jgi:hypothetical protein